MPKHAKIEKSPNSGYYTDVLWCVVPLIGMSCYYYGMRPLCLLLAALATAYVCDCLLAPLHGAGYRPHEPSSECFAALTVLMMPATVTYSIVIATVVLTVLVKEAFGGEGHYPFHPAAVGVAAAGISWPQRVFYYPAPGTILPLWGPTDVTLTAGMNAALHDGGLPSASTMNLLTGNVAAPLGTNAMLVIMACALFLLCRGRLQLSTVVPFFVVALGLAWLFPQLNELPVFSAPWAFVRQRVYLEKYILLSGTMLFGGVFLLCEPVTQPVRPLSRVIYGIALGVACYVFRSFSPYETGICYAMLIVGAFPEWLDLLGRRAERNRFMRKEAQRVARAKPE